MKDKDDLLLAAALTLMVVAANVFVDSVCELVKLWIGSGVFDFR